MPLKPGGGNLPQQYDPDNGQYTDEQKSSMLKNDKWGLRKLAGENVIVRGYEPHFPTYGIHDEEYCEMFVWTYKRKFNNPSIRVQKCDYLLTHQEEDDKSKKLISIGYSKNNMQELSNHILKYTDFKSVEYNSWNEFALKVDTITELKGHHKFLSIWKVNTDFTLSFVTLITEEIK